MQYLAEPITQNTVYIERRFNVCRVPTVAAVQEFLNLFEWGSRWRAFFSIAFYAGLRPCEICALTTDMILVDGERWTGLVYPVGKPKPTGRPRAGEKPRKSERKWNRIEERRGDTIGAGWKVLIGSQAEQRRLVEYTHDNPDTT